jgi:rubrerythrin
METGIVYLIQPQEFMNTGIYKFGKSTKQEEFKRCRNGYGKKTIFHHIVYCVEPSIFETNIKKSFNEKFELCQGKEYFKGDIIEMKKEFSKLLNDHEKKYNIKKINNINNEKVFKIKGTMIWICDVCGIKPIKIKSSWICHMNTENTKKIFVMPLIYV